MTAYYKNKRPVKSGEKAIDLASGVAGEIMLVSGAKGATNAKITPRTLSNPYVNCVSFNCLNLEDIAKATIPNYSSSPYGAYK